MLCAEIGEAVQGDTNWREAVAVRAPKGVQGEIGDCETANDEVSGDVCGVSMMRYLGSSCY